MPRRFGFTVPLLRSLLPAVAAGAYSALSLMKDVPPFSHVPDIPLALDAVLSFVMALLVAFRVNRAYERWWEARTLWGKLVNICRNLAIKVRLARPDADERREMCGLIVGFCTGLKDHLLDRADDTPLPGLGRQTPRPAHAPSWIASRIYDAIARWHQTGRLTGEQLWLLDAEARWLLEVTGGCERIKSTPMPISWRRLSVLAITLYLLVLPWGIVDDFGRWTIPLTAVAAFFVVTAEAVASQVEHPFGLHEDHLDLDQVCGAIERSVTQILVDETPGATS